MPYSIPTATILIHTVIFPHPLYLSNDFFTLISFHSLILVNHTRARAIRLCYYDHDFLKKVRGKCYPFVYLTKPSFKSDSVHLQAAPEAKCILAHRLPASPSGPDLTSYTPEASQYTYGL